MRRNEHKEILTQKDLELVKQLTHGKDINSPDQIICLRDGSPYIYRWHVVPRVDHLPRHYVHIQVQDDEDRHPHDHPWWNVSVIHAGGYKESIYTEENSEEKILSRDKKVRTPGETIFRPPEQLHLLELYSEKPYSISTFFTGVKNREWGFYIEGEGWMHNRDYIKRFHGIDVE